MSWPTTADGLWYIFDGQILIPINAETGAPILMLRPQGGMGVGIPAVADGADGVPPVIQDAVTFTELAHDDPTAASMSFTLVSPGPPPVYALTAALHKGAPGDETVTSLDMDSIGGTATAGNLIKVNAGATGFDYAFEKVAERFIPASINNTSAGNTNSTVATIPIAARNFDRRIVVFGHQIVRQSGGSSVVVDLAARLTSETAGNVVARCQGLGGTERLTFSSAIAPGSADAFDKITVAMGATNVYIRCEQQSGTNSYTTSNSEGRFEAWAFPIG